MSYSRWSTSTWYTFWHACSGHVKDEQYFEICAEHTFTYRQLKDDIEACLKKVQREEKPYTVEEMEELQGYMMEFISDVESDVELKYYEDFLEGKITDITKIIDWSENVRDEDLKNEINEALKILYATDNDLPLIRPEYYLGKTLIEKRFKGTLKQLV
jgi:hypothetical protein